MWLEIFNPANYYFNIWLLPYFVVGALNLLLVVFVCWHNFKSPVNRAFAFVLFVTIVWLTGYALEGSARTAATGFLLDKYYTFSGVALIAPSCYLFACVFRGVFQQRKKFIILGFAFNITLIISTLCCDFVIGSDAKRFWGNHPLFATPFAGALFVSGLALLMFCSFLEMVNFYRESAVKAQRIRIKYVLVAYMIAFLGITDFGPHFFLNWNVYPTGFFWLFVYFLIHAYVIARYKAFEIDTVIHQTILWMFTSSSILIPMFVILYFVKPYLAGFNLLQLTIITTVLFYCYLFYYRTMQPKIDHLFRRRKYEYQTILGKVAEKIATTINIEDLSKQLLSEVCEAMYLRNSILYVLSKDDSRYLLVGRRGYQEINGIRQRDAVDIYAYEDDNKLAGVNAPIECNDPLCKWLSVHQDILEKEQLEIDPKYKDIKQDVLLWCREHDVEVIVPVVFKEKANVILGLGKKENLQAYTVKDIQLLKKLGQEAGVTVFNALHYEDLAENERLEGEMKMGRDIQMTLLPRSVPEIPGLRVSGLMIPAKEIGGDYYDFITLPQSSDLSIVIGDVSGKGVAAGLLMAMAKTAIHALSKEEASPRQILIKANEVLNQHIGGQRFMTMLYLIWQGRGKNLLYSSAGHEHILIYRQRVDSIETIQSGGFMLGMMPHIEEFLEEKQITLLPSDKVLLYTDGVTEALDDNGERFGMVRLKEALKRYSAKSANELMLAIKDDVYAFIGNHPQYDDITLVVLEAI